MSAPAAEIPAAAVGERRGLVGPLGEALLVAILLVAWGVSFLSLSGALDGLSPGGRALFLVNSFTAENLTIGLSIGTLMVLALPIRHWSPTGGLVVVGGLSIALQWWYPLLFSASFVARISFAVAVLWVAWKVQKWWWPMLLIVAPFFVADAVRVLQINQRNEVLTSGPSSTAISISEILQDLLIHALFVAGGLGLRRFTAQRRELEERNRELIAERAKASESAVLDERLRISRELHDVVAHHVTTMTVHAGAARQVVETSPEKATESLRHIEAAGRNAVSELHQLLGFLRNADADATSGAAPGAEDRSPTPSLRHLSTLQESFGSKLTCDVVVDGDLGAVPSAVEVSAYRIIQESLTNTLKHSTADRVDVRLDVGRDSLKVEVCDAGPARNGESAPGGHGLVGMAERASLHGGEVVAGPAKSGLGWQVCAVLPFRSEP